jgi:hypothetical protein
MRDEMREGGVRREELQSISSFFNLPIFESCLPDLLASLSESSFR